MSHKIHSPNQPNVSSSQFPKDQVKQKSRFYDLLFFIFMDDMRKVAASEQELMAIGVNV